MGVGQVVRRRKEGEERGYRQPLPEKTIHVPCLSWKEGGGEEPVPKTFLCGGKRPYAQG